MNIQEFIEKYREAFGENVPLPIAFGYSDKAVKENCTVPMCMMGAISKVRNGEPLTLCADNVKCRGGRVFTAFDEMCPQVSTFVADIEHYKATPQMVQDYVDSLDIHLLEKPYLNFIRMDQLDTLDGMEGILCWATPDVLSGLVSWAFYDNNREDAVSTVFGSGCSSIISLGVRENRQKGQRCFIGMFDPSARLLVPANELSFVIPVHRFHQMLDTLLDSAIFQHAFTVVRKRIVKG